MKLLKLCAFQFKYSLYLDNHHHLKEMSPQKRVHMMLTYLENQWLSDIRSVPRESKTESSV